MESIVTRDNTKIPKFGLGTWQMGGRQERDPNNDDQRDIKAIRLALDSGITHIDTAEAYANGYTETLVAKALKGYERSQVFLASKVSGKHLEPEALRTSLEASLKRLETDYLDLYIIHSPNHQVPIEKTMDALQRLKEQGLIKSVGVSNFSVESLKAAEEYGEVSSNQVHYNLMVREAELSGLLEYCQKRQLALVAYRPVEKNALENENRELIESLREKYSLNLNQLSIAWLVSQEGVATLAKTSNPRHMRENLQAVSTKLDSADIGRLRAEYAPQLKVSPSIPLS